MSVKTPPLTGAITGSESFAARLRANLKGPVGFAIFTVLGALLFVGAGHSSLSSTFTISRASDFATIPSIVVPSVGIGVALVLVCAAITVYATLRVGAGRPVPPWLAITFGVAWLLGFLAWAAAGKSLPLTDLLQSALALSVPLIFGALAGILSERVGVVNIAIEGQLLLGAFGSVLIGSATGNPYLGIIGAPLGGLVMGALLALFAIKYAVDQIIVGVVLNVLASGLTGFLFGSLLAANGNALNQAMQLPTVALPGLSQVPVIGPILFNQTILVYLMYVIVAAVSIGLFKTKWGLRVRAVGEHPHAADTMGINVNLTRWKNVLLAGAVAGLGGAVLTLGTGVAFTKDMSAGQGYIALAAMILGRWNPRGAVIASLMFGFANALQIQLGIFNSVVVPDVQTVNIPTQFLLMLPYVVTIFAVAGLVGRVRGPAAAGTPYEKSH
ncbi:ABC transporter permease [Micrococcales bacterium 31B]|nr:ABC transporter permease [Micrococcales bacterium 31B]